MIAGHRIRGDHRIRLIGRLVRLPVSSCWNVRPSPRGDAAPSTRWTRYPAAVC